MGCRVTSAGRGHYGEPGQRQWCDSQSPITSWEEKKEKEEQIKLWKLMTFTEVEDRNVSTSNHLLSTRINIKS